MNVTDEALQKAASLVRSAELAQWSDFELYPNPPFSEKFEAEMQELIRRVRNGEIRQKKAKLGWQYYTGRGIAAILLCFLLTFAAMPEAVMASCQRIIEMVKTVLPEYTEYRIQSNIANTVQFVPVTVNYLPDGIKEVTRDEKATMLRLVYQNEEGQTVFVLHQELFTENMNSTYIVDTEDAEIDNCMLRGENLQMITKGDRIQFIWIYDVYLITGQTRLSKMEITHILSEIE